MAYGVKGAAGGNENGAAFSRGCPGCGGEIRYRTAVTLDKAVANATRCRGCVGGAPELAERTHLIREAHAGGLMNREIAIVAGCHHRTVAKYLRRMGLVSNLARGVPPERVDDTHSRCRRCREVQLDDQFPFVRGRVDARRLSICRSCRAKDARAALGDSPESYFNDRHRRMRNGERGSRPNRQGLAYDLPDGYLVALWHWQAGRCFYTDKPMKMGLGAGHDPLGVSIDRVDPHRGYVVGNVVLCCGRVNSIKSDVSLEELAEWMPGWFEQVRSRLPMLRVEVRAADDDWPRNKAGHRLPAWIVERRHRLAALTDLTEPVSPPSEDHRRAGTAA